MAYAHSDTTGVASEDLLTPFKIVIGGGFGVGKTTLVSSISEVRPLSTEETLSTASIGVDSLAGVSGKRTTTVALDYGRLTLGNQVTLYLFGLPGQERFSFLWDQVAYGALGAVVMADVRRLDDCFASVNYFEKMGLTFAIALNCFDEAPMYDPEEVRAALDLDPDVPIVMCDARESRSVRDVLITLVETIYASQYRAESRWA
ncbi:MAG: ATP/GTP-binding protein [Streptosporangiales bacterium]|jgi:signal recognition particle receptor subunit beta|nr:ATP/GTP-binding protein [Streptosporangiales bacterium]